MPTPEILAPAGGAEQLLAAVRCGADAVYLGTEGFNARRGAANFGPEALAGAARLCRTHGAKLYVTVNTLVMDGELAAMEETADAIAAAGADGVILQDMAALRLFAGRYPSLHRVASTQTAVHNADGARFLQDAGFDSFVLARELSLAEMEKICSAVSIPAEAFVHGAHCMSLSGACYLSAMLGGRSGNRGLCAQPCRLDWRCGGADHVLSLKDMSLMGHIRALAGAGVATLKIEGRMKRPEYVAAAVTACKNARAGEPFDADTLAAVFSRSGFTDGYLTGKRDRSMFGYRTKEDVTGTEKVLATLAALYRRENPTVPVDMAFSMDAAGARLTVSDGAHTAAADGPAPEPALTRPLDVDRAQESLSKTGGTQYYVNSFSADLAPGLTMPVSALNGMRRQALSALDDVRGQAPDIPRRAFSFAPVPGRAHPSPAPLWARFYRAEQIARPQALDRIILPIEAVTPALIRRYGDKLTGALPAVCFPEDEPALEARLEDLAAAGLREVWTENIYGVALGRRLGLAVRGGFGLNITNAQSVDFYVNQCLASLTLSFELPMSAVKALDAAVPWGIAVYGYLPLMRLRNCPVRAHLGCEKCSGQGSLTDRRGVQFAVECGERRYSTLLNSLPLHIAGRDDPGDFRLLWFTRESREQCSRVIEDFLLDRPADGPRTGGLYYRKLL